MNTQFLDQSDYMEILNLHEEEEDYDTNLSQQSNCANCMQCLDLSWKDFM